MLTPVKERLKGRSIEEVCKNAAIHFDPKMQEFIVPSMGKDIRITFPDFEIRQDLDMWHQLTLLQYMDTADGTPLSGTLLSLSEMPGGLNRGRGFEKDISLMFHRYFTDISASEFEQCCLSAGGEILTGKADITAVIPYAPRFPVTVSFWVSDEEFPASGKVMVNAAAEHYLSLDSAGGACASVIQELNRLRKQ